MSLINKYGLVGIGGTVQYGKGGGRIWWNVDHFELLSPGTSTYVPIHVPAIPQSENEAASKIYVDSVGQGLNPHQPVVAATTVSGTLTTSFVAGQIIDGYTLLL